MLYSTSFFSSVFRIQPVYSEGWDKLESSCTNTRLQKGHLVSWEKQHLLSSHGCLICSCCYALRNSDTDGSKPSLNLTSASICSNQSCQSNGFGEPGIFLRLPLINPKKVSSFLLGSSSYYCCKIISGGKRHPVPTRKGTSFSCSPSCNLTNGCARVNFPGSHRSAWQDCSTSVPFPCSLHTTFSPAGAEPSPGSSRALPLPPPLSGGTSGSYGRNSNSCCYS